VVGSVAAKARALGRGGACAESASACPAIVAMVVGRWREGTRGQTCTCSLLIRDPVRLESAAAAAAAGVAVVAVGRTNDDAATAPP